MVGDHHAYAHSKCAQQQTDYRTGSGMELPVECTGYGDQNTGGNNMH